VPRAGLSADRVVTEAADLADELGLAGLTLSAVAARLGVAVPSLYKHVDGTGGLHRALAARATRELADSLGRACVGRSGSAGLADLCRAYRSFARSHPGRYAATLQAPHPDDAKHLAAAADAVQVVDRVLASYGLSGTPALDSARTVRSALHGFVDLELHGGFGIRRSLDRSFNSLVSTLDAALTSTA